ncbi:hypothetical protein IEO21_02481 [Rhodonia placenta]|uniref:Dolichol phosphate-mannose biosynthesis regulatory protein n=1 Tax=Rhodonia placenta TaxID=104341 RepID=A0A8H7P7Q7_9APHY|nr:hypothetical protein IEO21_02481 [Postia placenta]
MLQEMVSDQVKGTAMLCTSGFLFTYYTIWAVLLPFFDESSPIHNMFPSREWAVRIPAFTLVTGISAVAIFIGLAIVSEQEPRRGQWPIHTPTIFIGFSAYSWWTWSLDPNTAIEVVRNPIPWAHSRRDCQIYWRLCRTGCCIWTTMCDMRLLADMLRGCAWVSKTLWAYLVCGQVKALADAGIGALVWHIAFVSF